MEHPTSNLFDLQVDNQSHGFLTDTAKWAKFLSIVGFIFCAIIAVVAVFGASFFRTLMSGQFGNQLGPQGEAQVGLAATMGAVAFTVIYLLLALLYFFPCLFLFRFSSRMQLALRTNDQVQLNTSLKNLKFYFRYMGILTIVVLSLWGIGILLAIIGLAFR
jgi:hypothetical protein